jgi:hypothetical protein
VRSHRLSVDAGDLLVNANRITAAVVREPVTDQVADQVRPSGLTHSGSGSAERPSSPTGAVVDGAETLIADFNGRVLEFNAPPLGSNCRTANRAFGTANPVAK